MAHMTDAQIIIALGDSAAVSAALGIPQNTVSNWKVRGISWPKRADVKELARKKRVSLPRDFLSNKRV